MSPLPQAPPSTSTLNPPPADARLISTAADRLTSAALGLVWALWTGGVIALFLFVTPMFDTAFRDDRPNAIRAAQTAFLSFGHYQLALAAIAVILTIAWIAQRRPR